MDRVVVSAIGALAFLGNALSPLAAQKVLHEAPDRGSPAATIDQAAWLAGSWRGVSDEGEEVFESWLGPSGAMMAGVALEYGPANEKDEASNWSEHMVIVSKGDTLAFHYDTFDAQIGGSHFIERRLLRIEDGGCKLFFEGVTFECERGDDGASVNGMTVYWREPVEEWNPEPELFTYRYTRMR